MNPTGKMLTIIKQTFFPTAGSSCVSILLIIPFVVNMESILKILAHDPDSDVVELGPDFVGLDSARFGSGVPATVGFLAAAAPSLDGIGLHPVVVVDLGEELGLERILVKCNTARASRRPETVARYWGLGSMIALIALRS